MMHLIHNQMSKIFDIVKIRVILSIIDMSVPEVGREALIVLGGANLAAVIIGQIPSQPC